jgi:hypothetical protein
MAVNYPAKSKAPDLSPTPEESADSESDERAYAGGLPQNRSGFNLSLQERLLSYGNHGSLSDDAGRMGRRPSVGSISVDGLPVRDRESDDGGYFNMKRVHSDLYTADIVSLLVTKAFSVSDAAQLHRKNRATSWVW